ncbi:hypothetical protein [Streptomyces sp. N35]|uniref:hypothetical protein n=1 Tax=Streptomyces sp. N35 TaxID=2795730 RepID=UPI0018F6B3A0|nr:hypothetical protein [Streptomyces sp. N35]
MPPRKKATPAPAAAEFSAPLPPELSVGAGGHIEHHNQLLAAVVELRAQVAQLAERLLAVEQPPA